MLARLATLLVALTLVAPAGALAQSSPFTPLPPSQQETQTTPTVTVDNGAAEDQGLSGLAKAAIVAFGALLLAGIAWLIMRDARARAPVPETEAGPKGTRSPQRHARARAKAKRAKQQRKRNRARR
jgi:hypothetical protein